jgi:hypothetical protein
LVQGFVWFLHILLEAIGSRSGYHHWMDEPIQRVPGDTSSTYSYGQQKTFWRWQLPVAIATIVVGFFGLIYLKRILSATKQSANVAQKAADTTAKQLELLERPWMSADVSIAGPLVFDKSGAHLSLDVILNNTGHSPAIRTFTNVEFFAVLSPPGLFKERERFCNEIGFSSSLPSNAPLGDTYLPGEKTPRRWNISISSAEIEKATSDFDGSIVPEIILCIAYHSNFASVQYHTGYIFNLRGYDPNWLPSSTLGIRPAGGEIPPARLMLIRFPFGGVNTD